MLVDDLFYVALTPMAMEKVLCLFFLTLILPLTSVPATTRRRTSQYTLINAMEKEMHH
jgi:hypothetical protein